MKRISYGMVAIFAACTFAACGDKNDPPKDGGVTLDGKTSDGTVFNEAGSDTTSDGGTAQCDSNVLGKRCTENGGECGNGATCLLTSQTKGGICTCECTPDDPGTPLVNENSCPDPGSQSCGSITLQGGQRKSFCFKQCTPKLGSNECAAPIACDPRSGSVSGSIAKAACYRFGCEADKDCPVITSTTCDTASKPCPSGEECLPLETGKTAGLCGRPGKCDTASGLCAPRDKDFKAGAKVGDGCKDDTECDKNMRCERETDLSTVQKKGGEACTEGSECCSGRCTGGKCEDGLCTIHARNGYCLISGCAFNTTLTEFACPAGATCNKIFFGGICMKSCDINNAADCRGNTADKYGDFECRAWNQLVIGQDQIADGPVCDFGDTVSCDLFANSKTVSCETLFMQGDPQNPTNKTEGACYDLTGTKTTDQKTALGLCLDNTASGPK